MVCSAYNKSLDLLAIREHSAKELRVKLLNRNFDEDDIIIAIKKLQHNRLQSDSRFAEVFVRSWANKGRGPIRIKYDLEQHGLPADLIETNINCADYDWLAIITEVWEKKFNCLPQSLSEKSKQFMFLQRRGFPSHMIYSVINK